MCCDLPTTSNTGVKAYRKAINPAVESVPVFIDYLSFTLKTGAPSLETVQAIAIEALGKAAITQINEITVREETSGYQGWQKSALVIKHGIVLALLAWGGSTQRQRIFISFTGKGCEQLNQHGFQYLHEQCASHDGNITRIDLSADDFQGKTSLGSIRNRYYRGQFNAGGRPPEKREFTSNKGGGNSIYVGGKNSSKQLRIYEKGKQLGKTDSPWLRIEVQLRRQTSRSIPIDVLLKPAPYFVGSYPALELIFKSFNITPTRLKTVTTTVAISVEKLLKNISRGAGRAIGFLISSGADEKRLVDFVRRSPGRYEKQFNTNIVREALTTMHLTNPNNEPP